MRFKILDIPLDSIKTEALPEAFKTALLGDQFNHIATINPEFCVTAQHDEVFKTLLNKTALNICDGSGISLWSKILYQNKIPRTTGVEVAETICATAANIGKSVYFLGGFDVAQGAAEKMKLKYPNLIVAGFEDGSPKSISDACIKANPDAILVAFGAPAQELWIDKFHDQIPNCRLAGGFGGTFDFWNGKLKRAPQWMQKAGVEWLFRLIQEPKTRGKRIGKAVVTFSILVLKERFRKSSDQ